MAMLSADSSLLETLEVAESDRERMVEMCRELERCMLERRRVEVVDDRRCALSGRRVTEFTDDEVGSRGWADGAEPNGGSDSGRLEGDKAGVNMGEEQAAVVVRALWMM